MAKQETEFTRRAFVGIGAAAVVALPQLAVGSPAPGGEVPAGNASTGAGWRTPPAPIADSAIAETFTADVIVIGGGQAGTNATRAAAEDGATVICLEKMPEDTYSTFGNDIGHINSEYLASQGVPKVDEVEFFNNWMLASGYRASSDLVMKFTKECGAAFDWWHQPLGEKEMASCAVDFWPATNNTIYHFNSGLKYWIGCAQFYGQVDGVDFRMTDIYRIIHSYIKDLPGAEIHYGTTAEQLVMDGAKVIGVIAVNADGAYVKYLANKGTILAAGDFSANQEMREDLLQPQQQSLEPGEQLFGMGRDGSGIKMGVWAGGKIEPMPLACLGADTTVPSPYPCLWLDMYGKRYQSEMVGDSVPTGYMHVRHKHGVRYIVFDATILEQLTFNVPGHGAFDPTPEGALEGIQESLDSAYIAGAEGFTPPRMGPGGGTIWAADDLETLAGYLDLDVATKANFLASIEQYNRICDAKRDTDYGKDPRLLFPVRTAPFYAMVSESNPGMMLTTNGGLEVDGDQRVLNETRDPIEGLFATGNCTGLRFGPAYFTPIAGVSLGMAITLGRAAGKFVASL